MANQEKAQLTIYVSQEIRLELQKMAAKKMLEHPQKNFSAGNVAVDLLVECLTPPKKIKGEENEK